MNILITGINGFLGRRILHFFKNSYSIKGIGTKSQKIEDVEVFSSKNLDEISFTPDYIIMCHAAISSGIEKASIKDLFEVNVNLTKQILEKFEDSRIIYISSVSVYQDSKKVILENSEIYPKSSYAISKFWAEQIVHNYKNSIILRVASMYGENMKANTIIPNYVKQALHNNEIQVWGDGSRTQNYIHVTDVVKYIYEIFKGFDKFNKRIFLGVSENEHTNLELATIIADILKVNISFVQEDHSLSYSYDNTYTRNMLKLNTEIPFKDGIEKYITWRKK
ncbi:NAD(P)-dependent oxidoreductase [uncultured Zobellia sp.]|uniref:NAD-dependent epimerase/dehydratase family protein n=1 Tax=uncultured Zobellia sp. TaxID=255433 RepID=UPI0025996D1A|nr:NAD(P)-dependent oxidoreductase [uncultured Zobellia sp.]